MSKKTNLIASVKTIDPEHNTNGMKVIDLELWLELHKKTEDETEVKSMSNTMQKYRTKYEPSLSASGRKSLNTGDEIAHLLAGMEPKAVIAATELLLNLKTNELWDKYSSLNAGQQRMNAGNKIRGATKRGELTVAQVKKVLKAG